ncbi:MAG: glycosyltransferase family 2 protein [Cyanobacteriota bacterium]|nr:glycosyltransferase family 2 protein [Cyanobacteriota bacterium]
MINTKACSRTTMQATGEKADMVPKVSVIIPNYNHSLYLKERLESVIGQTYQDFELIILDDCSSDNSVEVIKSHLRDYPYQLVINPVNSGSTFAQWDRGISLARGELIWIAESDDVAAPDFLETLVAKLEDSAIAMAYCQSFGINENSAVTAQLKGWTDHISSHLWRHDFCVDGTFFALSFMAIKNIIPNASAVVFRRQHYTSPYLLKPDYKLGGDLILWVSIMREHSLAYVAKPLNYYRFHTNTVRRSQRDNYLDECCSITSWILETTQAWREPGNLTLAREHLARLWFSIGLEPASARNWWIHKKAYRLLYELHGPWVIFICLRRMPVSLWRITRPHRLWWTLGLRSLRMKVQRKLRSGKD